MATFGQLRTLTLSWLDDINGTYFTSSQVNVWLNNAQREVQKQLIEAGENYYVTKMSGSTALNQDTYALPTDFKKCHKFEIVVAGAGTTQEIRQVMTPVTYVQLEQVSQTIGVPTSYNIKRNVVTLRPIPDNTYTMYMHQSYMVVDMVNDGDLPDVPADFHEYIAVLATLDGFMKDQRDPAAFVTAKQEKYLMMLRQSAQDRDVSTPRSIVVTENFAPGFLF